MASIVLKQVSDDLHYRLKVRAAETGVTMRDLILEALESAVAKPGVPGDRSTSLGKRPASKTR